MGRNKNLKSGASLIVMLVCMAVIASVFGYFISSWVLDYVAEPDEESIVEEETIGAPDADEEDLEDEFKVDNEEGETSVDADSRRENFAEEDETSNLEEIGEDTETDAIEPTESDELYTIQVGAFSDESNAEQKVSMLQEKGFSGYITTKEPYRVQVGAFKTEEAASDLKEELTTAGFSVYISN